MKYQNRKKSKKNPKTLTTDAFFEPDPKRQRPLGNTKDEELESLQSEDEDAPIEEDDKDGEEVETAAGIKYRIAREQLEKIREAAKRAEEEEEEEDDREEREERTGSLIGEILMKKQLEESGRARRSIASRVLRPESLDDFCLLVKHRQSVTSVTLPEDDRRGFSASKDGTIVHRDVESGKPESTYGPARMC